MSNNNQHTKAPARRPGGPMGGPMGGMGTGEKAKDFKTTMVKLIKYLKPYYFVIIIVILFAILSTVLAIYGPKKLGTITSQVVDDYTNMMIYDEVLENLPIGMTLPAGTKGSDILKMMENNPQAQEKLNKLPEGKIESIKNVDFSKRPSVNFDFITRAGIFLIILFLASATFSYIQGFIMSSVAQKITYNFRRDLSQKINRMPLKYFDTKTHGDILSRVTNDIDLMGQTLNQSMSQIVTSITMVIGILVMMLTISWQMTIVAMLVLPLSMGIIGAIVKKSQKHFKVQQASLGEINGHIEEMYSGHNVVKVFGAEKRSIKKFMGINGDLYTSSWKSQFLSGLMMPIMLFVGNLGYVGVCVIGGWLAVKGQIKIGDIQAFISYVRQFNQPIAQMAQVANILQSTAAAAERVFGFLEDEELCEESENQVVISDFKGEVEFNDVVFGYDPEKIIIKGFSTKIKPGQRVAIVGPTGAGKTTLVNLLMRFYDVNSGSIKIDGIDIRDMKRSDLRKLFGMVLQDTWLFNGTIKENIAYGKLGASEEEIVSASKAAHVDRFIHSLPNGYDMELNEEASNISQGQKQLLTIARAMLENATMLILDEATSSVDTRTEVLIQKAMEKLMVGRTSFVIAHRLSTIKDADLILVMKDGNVIEQGTHDELISQNGFYYELYNSQFETSVAS